MFVFWAVLYSTRGGGVSGIHKDSEIATLAESDILSNHQVGVSDLNQFEVIAHLATALGQH